MNIYVIENGELFEGTLEQFEDNFFSGASDALIREWCIDNGFTLTVRSDEMEDQKT